MLYLLTSGWTHYKLNLLQVCVLGERWLEKNLKSIRIQDLFFISILVQNFAPVLRKHLRQLLSMDTFKILKLDSYVLQAT